MIVKKHITKDGRLVLAVCDSELLCKKIEDDKIVLDLDSDFYKGEKMSKEGAEKLMKQAYVVNLVGDRCIESALKIGIIDKDGIIKVKGVKHCQAIVCDRT